MIISVLFMFGLCMKHDLLNCMLMLALLNIPIKNTLAVKKLWPRPERAVMKKM